MKTIFYFLFLEDIYVCMYMGVVIIIILITIATLLRKLYINKTKQQQKKTLKFFLI